MAGWRAWERTDGGCWWCYPGYEIAVRFPEYETITSIGVTLDREMTFVDAVMVAGTETTEITNIGRAALAPMQEMVDLKKGAGCAAGIAASVVSVEYESSGVFRDDAGGPADVDRVPGGLPYGLHDTITGDPFQQRLRNLGALIQP
jgi:hypothetical protein